MRSVTVPAAAALLAGLAISTPPAEAAPASRVTFNGGRLIIVGDGGPNTITVTRTPHTIAVVVDGQKLKLRPRPKPDTLTSIRVRGKGGDDVIVLDESGGPLPDATLQGGLGNDRLVGGSGATRLIGKDGNDTMTAGAGPTSIDAGPGDDTLTGGPGPVAMLAGAGNDVLVAGAGNANMDGSDGNDLMTGGSGNDTMNGGAGTDTMTATSGAATMNGGDGNDVLKGGAGFTSLAGGPGQDKLTGGDGTTTMTGGSENDQLIGGNGSTTMDGDEGDDTMTAGSAPAGMHGGNGDDTYAIDGDIASGLLAISESGGQGTDTVTFAATTSVGVGLDLSVTAPQPVTAGALTVTLSSAAGIERVVGGDGDDELGGNNLVNTFTGGAGQDTVVHRGSGGQVDTVVDMDSSDGDQVRFETAGALSADDLTINATATQLRDVATGAFGFNFTAPVLHPSSFYVFGTTDTSPAGQLITFNAPGGFGQGSNVDSLIATMVSSGVSIGGAGGADRMIDHSPNGNSLIGRDGQDILFGGAGADDLQGDRGFAPGVADVYVGGTGADTFHFGEAFGGGSLETFGSDTIGDFGDGADTVDLFTGLSVHSGLGTSTVTIWDGATDFGTITAGNGHLWIAGDFT